MSRFLSSVVSLVFVAMVPAVSKASEPADVIDYRKHIMKTMDQQVTAITMIMQKKAPADNFALHVETLAVAASTALKAFEPKVEGGRAKAEVWAKWPDFTKRMKELQAATSELAKVAGAGGMAAAAPKLQGALTCKGCHDVYRETK